MKNRANQLGFTIIEIMIVVTIVATIVAAAVPSFSNIIKNQRIRGVTSEIVSTLQTARSEAVKRSTRVTVCFKQQETGNGCQNLGTNVINTNYIYAFIDDDNSQSRNGSEETLYQSNRFNESVLFKHPSTASMRVRRSISFDARGNANFGLGADAFNNSQREGVIGLCDDRNDNTYGRVIRVGKTGRTQAGQIQSNDGITC